MEGALSTVGVEQKGGRKVSCDEGDMLLKGGTIWGWRHTAGLGEGTRRSVRGGSRLAGARSRR
jgi:hypothetical protein